MGIQGKKKKKPVFYFGTFYVCSLQGGGDGGGGGGGGGVCVCVREREIENLKSLFSFANFEQNLTNKQITAES